MNGNQSTTMTASPIAPVRRISRQPPWVQNHAANGRTNGSAWGLVMTQIARNTAASALRPSSANTRAAMANSR